MQLSHLSIGPGARIRVVRSVFGRHVVGAGLVLVTLFAAGCGGGSTGSDEVEPAFHVVAIEPADGRQDVALDAPIRITFNRTIDARTVRSDAVEVGAVERGTAAGRAALAPDGAGRVLEWTPTAPLFAGASHRCLLDGALRSDEGHTVGGRTTFTFRTVDAEPEDPLPPQDALRPTAGRLDIGRRSHTATMLFDGRVLIAGGFRQGTSITDRAEVYDDEQFELVPGSMEHERAGHVAVLLADGRVLLAGGWYEAQPGQLATTDHAEVFDPDTGLFESAGVMSTARVDHRALRLPDGRVLVTGGSRLDGGFLTDLASAEVFDPTTDTFSPLAAGMLLSRATHVMEHLGSDRIVLFGGNDTDLRPEVFDVAAETFYPIVQPAQDGMRFGAMGARFVSGAVMVAGGDDLGTVVHVDRHTSHTQNTGSGLSRPRAYGTATRVANDRVLVVGGFDTARGLYLLNTADIVVEGGIAGSRTYATELRFPTGMVLHTATRLGNGNVLFCGGLNEVGDLPELDGAYLYEP